MRKNLRVDFLDPKVLLLSEVYLEFAQIPTTRNLQLVNASQVTIKKLSHGSKLRRTEMRKDSSPNENCKFFDRFAVGTEALSP